jgi:hypothetical protein
MRPRIEQAPDGALWLVVPFTNGAADLRVELSPEGLTGLASDIGAHFERLRTDPAQMKKVGASLVSGLVDLFTKGK